MKPRILVVDDESLLRWSVARRCEEWGYECAQAADCAEARSRLRAESFDLVLLDVRMPDGSGVDLLAEMRRDLFSGPVILITADPKVEDVKTALRQGAYDYLVKPIQFDDLQVTVANALEASRLRQEVAALRQQAESKRDREVVGASPIMRQVLDYARRAAASEANAILLQGESGTGKDLMAQVIHRHSARRDKPYVPVNCSAIPETLLEAELFGHEKGAFTDAKAMKKGLFEVADGGTIFLDEIGEMPLALQSKLLRTLEDQTLRRLGGLRDIQVNVRMIAASNRNLEAAVQAGRFRADLYYRLMVIPIFIPPLRSRREDVPLLSAFFIEQYNRQFGKKIEGLTPEAQEMMAQYSWPGNIRELKNAIQRAMILEDGPLLRAASLPFSPESNISTATAFPAEADAEPDSAWEAQPNGRALPRLRIPRGGTSLEGVEKRLVAEALRQCDGNQSQAARLLDTSRDTIRYAMKKYQLGDHGQHG
jgi:two-component system response regulator AtoC